MFAVKAVLSALLVFASLNVQAETAPMRSIAVLSLAGNSLALHVQRHQVGSRTENAPVEVRPMDDPVFDQVAIIAARTSILRMLPNAKLNLMTTQDKGLYSAQNDMFEHPEQHLEDREYLKTLLKEQGCRTPSSSANSVAWRRSSWSTQRWEQEPLKAWVSMSMT